MDGQRQNNIPLTSSGKTSTMQRTKCHAQEHKTVFQVRLEPAAPRSLVKHSTTPQLWSIVYRYDTCPTQYAPHFKDEHIVFRGYTICSSREHIVYGAFCGSTRRLFSVKCLLV